MDLDKLMGDIFGQGGVFDKAMKKVSDAGSNVNIQAGRNINSSYIHTGRGNSVSINGNQVKINGKSYTLPPHRSLSINNGTIILDGKLWAPDDGQPVAGIVELIITGDPVDVRTDYGNITVNGNVAGSVDAGGSVNCNNVGLGANAGGSVKCGDVGGGANAGGSVHCGKIGGSVMAGGSVRHG